MIGLACSGLVDHVLKNILKFLWLVASVADADADPGKNLSADADPDPHPNADSCPY
jgi:hypothetical protein